MIQKTSQSGKGRLLVDFLHSIHKEMAVVDISKLTKLIEAWYAFEKCFVLRTFQKNGITNGRGHSRITRPSLFSFGCRSASALYRRGIALDPPNAM
ncbi:MAG: hypothetical protein VW622_11650, partial [Opitutae bacterium]